jgi:cytochrome c556
MMPCISKKIVAPAIAVLVLAVPARSHDHATGVVKERMDMMEEMAKRMKVIRARIDTKTSLSAIREDAGSIASHAPHLVHLFPPESTQKPTDAKSAIWHNWPDFERKAAVLETESKKLMNISTDDLTALSAQFRAVLAACSGCHEKYRTKSRKGDM